MDDGTCSGLSLTRQVQSQDSGHTREVFNRALTCEGTRLNLIEILKACVF